MTGTNKLDLNTATMIEIVQYWLDNKFLNKDEKHPRVTHVEAGSLSAGAVFIVTLEEGS